MRDFKASKKSYRFGQRQFIGYHHPLRKVFHVDILAPFSRHNSITVPTNSLGTIMLALI